jgi:hypothetical protein
MIKSNKENHCARNASSKLELQLRGIRAAGGGDWAKFESAGVIDRHFNGEFRYWMTVSRATADSASTTTGREWPRPT